MPSLTIPWLHAAVCRPVLVYLDSLGVPLGHHFERNRLPLHEWNESSDVIPRHPFGRVLTDVARSQGLDRIGWDAVMHMRTSRKEWVLATSPEPTLYLALKAVIVRARALSSIDFRMEEAPRSVRLCRRDIPPVFEHDHHLAWAAWAIFLGVIRDYAGEEWTPPRMAIPSSAVGPWVAEQFPNTQLLPGDTTWWFEIPRPLLSLGRVQSHPLGLRGAREVDALSAPDLPLTLSRILRTYLPSGAPTLEFTAEVLGTSSRTLRRRLRESNRTYAGVLEEARFLLARQLLESTDQAVAEIAYATGYESPSNFARAFRRVAGTTPRQFRTLKLSNR